MTLKVASSVTHFFLNTLDSGNKMPLAKKEVYIGYWNNSHNQYPQFGMPVDVGCDNTKVVSELEAVFEILTWSTARKVDYTVEAYRGLSGCRICGIMNGNEEHEVTLGDTKYLIPKGYVHYLKDHHIAPDPQLQTMFNEVKRLVGEGHR
jgi:hypothetical protein